MNGRPPSQAFLDLKALAPGEEKLIEGKSQPQVTGMCRSLWGKGSYRTSKEAGGVRVKRL